MPEERKTPKKPARSEGRRGSTGNPADLRRRAEEHLNKGNDLLSKGNDLLSKGNDLLSKGKESPLVAYSVEVNELLHELSVYHIELEMQNEELRISRDDATQAHARYFGLYDMAPIGYAGLDRNGVITDLNLTGAGILGRERRYCIGTAFSLYVSNGDQPAFATFIRDIFVLGRKLSCVLTLQKKGEPNGSIRMEAVLPDPAGDPPVCRAAFSDITEQLGVERDLRATTIHLKTLIDSSAGLIVVWDQQHIITLFNKAFERLTGRTAASVTGRPLAMLFPEAERDRAMAKIGVADGGSMESVEIPILTDRGVRTVLWNAAALYDPEGTWTSTVAQGQDITERKAAETELRRKEQRLSESLEEKEILLAEIHHRVKNNLASFISLLSLEGAYEDSPKSRQLRSDLQNRARSMALIHEILYRTKNYSRVDMNEYLNLLVHQVMGSYTAIPDVEATIDARDTFLDITRATPAGLIVNELLTNSLKYAWPPGFDCEKERGGACSVTVSLRKNESGYVLEYADNGIGLPRNIDPEKTKTLGLKLVSFLARHQMRADVDVERDRGTKYIFHLQEGDIA